MSDSFPDLVTVNEAAELLRCSPSTVRYEISVGRIPAVRLGLRGVLRIDRADLARLVAAATGAVDLPPTDPVTDTEGR